MRRLVLAGLLVLLLPASSRAADTQRLLVIGDSLAAGLYATSQDAGFAYGLARGLGADLGILGATTVAAARSKLPAWQWAPTVVVVELGLNDSAQAISTEAYLADYAALLDEIGVKWPTARIVMTTLWAGATDPPERVAYSNGLRALAAERGLVLADVAEATRECGCAAPLHQLSPFPPGYKGDGWHPDNEGHRLIAETILDVLRPRVALPMVR